MSLVTLLFGLISSSLTSVLVVSSSDSSQLDCSESAGDCVRSTPRGVSKSAMTVSDSRVDVFRDAADSRAQLLSCEITSLSSAFDMH